MRTGLGALSARVGAPTSMARAQWKMAANTPICIMRRVSGLERIVGAIIFSPHLSTSTSREIRARQRVVAP
jgi:hypothetical protein